MFEPKYFEYVKLRVKRFLLDDMLEKFGEYASVQDDQENVIIRVKIGISDSFCRWVMRYGSDIEILSPEHIRSKFQEELQKVLEKYQK